MVLVPVTQDNVDAYVDFLIEHGGEEDRVYLETVDVRPRVIQRANAFFWQAADGRTAATLSVGRTPHRLGPMVSVFIQPERGNATALPACLKEFMAAEPRTADEPRRYRLAEPEDMAMPAAELAALGFTPRAGRYKYRRDPGPPREGEFPDADKALAAGYVTLDAVPDVVAAEPDLFARLTDLYNRAFAGQPGVRPREEADMREFLTVASSGFLVAFKEGVVTGYLCYTPLKNEVLVGEYAAHRRHWGTGSVDLLCRHVAALVAERWNWPIIGFADAENAPSCAAMERAGMDRVQTITIWERIVEAGVPLDGT